MYSMYLMYSLQIILKNIGIKNIIHDVSKQMNKRDHLDFYEYYDQETLDKVNFLLYEDFQKIDYPIIREIEVFNEKYKNKHININI
jgi:hypothetical protein